MDAALAREQRKLSLQASNAAEPARTRRASTLHARLWLAAWCCSLGFACPAAAQVAVVSRVPADRAVLEQLAGMLDEPVHDRPEPVPRGLAAILGDAQHWPERYVVVIDRMEDSVHVLRPSDQTIVSRVLAAEVLADSHYAVALATAELLEWLGAAPRAETAVDVEHAPRAGPPPAAPTAEARGAESTREDLEATTPELGVALGVGLQLSASPGADISLARLAGDAELQLGRGLRSPWFALGLRVAAPASIERALDPAAGGAGVTQVEYASSELGLHAAIGMGTRGAALAVGPVAGLAFVDVTARGAGGAQIGVHHAKAGMLGAGVWLRYPLAWGLGLGLAAEAQWLLSPERYRVAGQRVLQDGALRLQTQLGLVWESALAPL
jgi:hypothetical protein